MKRTEEQRHNVLTLTQNGHSKIKITVINKLPNRISAIAAAKRHIREILANGMVFVLLPFLDSSALRRGRRLSRSFTSAERERPTIHRFNARTHRRRP